MPETKIRLAKYLAMTGLCSRRAATRHIRDARITIDGRIANHIDTITLTSTLDTSESAHEHDSKNSSENNLENNSRHAHPALTSQETLAFDGVLIAGIEKKQYWMFNKAVGTDSRLLPDDPDSLIHLLPTAPRLYPVGRLDKDSRGLMLLTNDGQLTQKLMHPDFGHSKCYHVQVERDFDSTFLTSMAKGVSYRDVTTLPCKMSRLASDKFEIILTQGLNRQIRRMSQALGYKVIDLKRVSIQSLALGKLAKGEMRQLSDSELSLLKSALE